MSRLISIIVLCCFMLVSLTACFGSHELDDWGYVYTIGIDKGVTDKLRFTYQLPTFKGGPGGGSGGGGGSESHGRGQFTVLTVDCPTFYSGINMLNTSLSRTLNFAHTKFVLISEELARDGVGTFMNGMMRSPQLRATANIIIVKGSASDFVREFDPVIGTSISKTQDLIMEHQYETGLFDEVTFREFTDDIRSTYSQPTAALGGLNDLSHLKTTGTPPEKFKSSGDYFASEVPRSGGNKFEFFGTAIFDGDKMVGALNGDETRVMLMTNGEFENGSIVIADPLDSKLRITVYTHQQRGPDVKVNFENGKPVISVKLFLEGELENVQSSTNYESPKLKPIVENAFKDFIKGELNRTILKCQKLNCEVFNFGNIGAAKFLTIQEWEKYNWVAHFKDAKVTTNVEFILRRTGTMMKTSEIETTKGKKK